MDDNEYLEIYEKAINIRKSILKLSFEANSGHPGGSLSIADIMAVLYFSEMRINPLETKDPNRDRLVLSKGHAAPALYGALKERGFLSEEDMSGFRKIGGILQGHPDMKHTIGVDMSTGSLGQGISVAVGMAMAGKLDNKDYRVYVILGDGEIEEGQVWEALMSATHYKLDNLCVIVDNNNLQIDGTIEEVMNSYPIDEKFKAFGFNTINIDGNKIEEIQNAFTCAKIFKDKPTAIIAKTIKGKGISYMENKVEWHGKAPNQDEYEKAIQELNKQMEQVKQRIETRAK
ncbi:MAG: transketolase [Clostridia bacterium]|nr:transketolase [Clostridia bacterium]